MSTKPGEGPPVRRIDKVLAGMSLGILLLSVVCFISVMIAGAVGVTNYTGIWPTVFFVQFAGPVVAFVLLLTLLIMSFIRRGRANRE
ncbi:multidrug ABC transporter ATPase [Microbacterium amylolyticum]|uniref:Membrane protein n=1 Tax=Microbacterium amylolyticum TaxID=936337 RepID=A0ABS4ZIX1_9MICO|nr:multidrug ABC transporter ATPase [Microbacterium amylolyticum]MBP2437233.1 putative membrane protein [Microbacterium amylolyticum]